MVYQQQKLVRFGDYYVFEVKTGSMQDTLKIGDLILVKKESPIRENDIITYQEKNIYITHRVVEISDENIITKGDSNNVEDAPITKTQIVGKYIKTLSVLTFIKNNKFLFIISVICFVAIKILVEQILDKKESNEV